MALQKPYKCMPLSGVFSKVLTQKFLYLLIGNSLRVGITNPCGRAALITGLEFASGNVLLKTTRLLALTTTVITKPNPKILVQLQLE